MFAYLAFRCLDQYVEILSHISPTDVQGYDPIAVLEQICTHTTVNDMHRFYQGLRVQVSGARRGLGAEQTLTHPRREHRANHPQLAPRTWVRGARGLC